MGRKIIWSDLNVNYDDWKYDYEDYCRANGLEYDEDNLYEWVNETLNDYIEGERYNLRKNVDGVIVAFASLGLWDGRVTAAKAFGSNIADILYTQNCDYSEWYCDRYNVRFEGVHHDGRNRYLYRVAKDEDAARRLVYKIAYHGMTEKQFMKATKSLRPYVAKVYGWC